MGLGIYPTCVAEHLARVPVLPPLQVLYIQLIAIGALERKAPLSPCQVNKQRLTRGVVVVLQFAQ